MPYQSLPVAAIFLLGSLLIAAAPPRPVLAGVKKYIEQLADDDALVRKEAMKKLEARGEEVVERLQVIARTHADVDVRLRAAVVVAAIEKKLYGEVRRFADHRKGAITVAVRPDGKLAASGSWQGGSEHAILL
jgi:hypothetical protein